jgi:hypothetical protein
MTFMGPLTTSLTFVDLDDKAFKLAVNLRVPKGKSPEKLGGDPTNSAPGTRKPRST